MAVRAVAEDDDVAGGELRIVRIARARTDLFELALRNEFFQCVLPSQNRLRARARGLDGIGEGLRIRALDIGEVVADEVGHEACTAKALLCELGDIRRFSRHGRGIGDGFSAGGGRAVVDIRQDIRRIVFQSAAIMAGLIDRAVILLFLHIVAGIGQRSDDGVVEHFGGDVRGRCRKHHDGESADHHSQGKEQG